MRLGTALASLGMALSACSPPPPLAGGPPPVYETPRPFPVGAQPSASSTPVIAPKSELPPYGTDQELAHNVDEYMKGYGSSWGEAFAPSGILVVSYKGKVVVEREYGKADRKKGTPIDKSTLFRIGSLTKQFTATAIVKLLEKGVVKLDESIRTYVPELPEAYKQVTIDELLHHTSGIRSYTTDQTLMKRKTENVPASEVVSWIGKQDFKAPPGSVYAYSNSNYFLLSLVIERTSKEPLEQFMHEVVFAPAGMKSTTSTPKGEVAVGYTRTPEDTLKDATVVSNSLPMGAGFLYSSAADLLAWDDALWHQNVVSEEEKALMWKPEKNNYAMGVFVMRRDGVIIQGHNGGIDGFAVDFVRVPEQNLVVMFLSNVADFDATQVGRDVVHMAVTGKAVPAPTERPVQKIDEPYRKAVAGDYELTPEAEQTLKKANFPAEAIESVRLMDITTDGGALVVHPSGQENIPVRRATDGTLFNTQVGIELKPEFPVTTAPAGQAKAGGFTIIQGGLSFQYKRAVGGSTKPKIAAN